MKRQQMQPGEVHDSTDATAVTPTRTRRNGDATVSTVSIPDASEKSNLIMEGRPVRM